MAKLKGHAKQFADWEEKPVKDYDPEVEASNHDDYADSDSDDSVQDDAGTEHYVAVGKSKLRRREPVALGPRYRGSRVSRDALDQSSDDGDEDDEEIQSSSDEYEDALEGFDDPDTADLEHDRQALADDDAEIPSDDALAESDADKLEGFAFRGSSKPVGEKGKRPSAADFMDEEAEESDGSEDVMGVDGLDDHEEEDGSGDEDSSDLDGFIDDGSDSEDHGSEEDQDADSASSQSSVEDEEDGPKKKHSKKEKNGRSSLHAAMNGSSGRADVQAMLSAGTETTAGAVASSLQKDVAKGMAVRQARKAFDAALNIRIRLQKALVAVNSFSETDGPDSDAEPYEAAEAAAIKLLNTIHDYRTGMQPKAGKKRKRDFDPSDSSQDIWNSLQSLENPAKVRRRAVLENWSKKVKATQMVHSGTGKASKLAKADDSLTMMLESQLQDTERLVKRTRVPRSCAPAQAAQKLNEADIYDDADFYQALLKDLVDRTTDGSGAGGQAATIRYTVAEAKNRKQVNRKASKGRTMRFNVHEKLQNFMPSEDRRTWEQHAIDRFFGSLFGQKMVLNEDDVSDEEMDDRDAAEEGLRLFRS